MTLSKQLYIIISFIFFMIFVGNFIISVNNFKDYLLEESTMKSQDTATSLGMNLKLLIKDKTDPEITSTIRAIANRGFYKEIRLEDIEFNFTEDDLINSNEKIDDSYDIKNVYIDINDGVIINSDSDNTLANELSALEGEDIEEDSDENTEEDNSYSFIPSKEFSGNTKLTIFYVVNNDTTSLLTSSQIKFDKILVKVTREEKFEAVPKWFINFLPMKMVETKSEISNGWKTQAVIYVSANAGEAYFKLYEQAKGAIYYAIISFIISIMLLIIFLKFILQPLKDIEVLAKNISKGSFETIQKLPWTLELKNVSISMNDMSNKIKDMISKLNSNLGKITEQLSKDDLTGLEQEQTFNTDMKQMFIKKQDGYIFSIKIDNFAGFAKNNTNKIVDGFIQDFALILNKSDKDIKAYRFYGSVFAMISEITDHNEIIQLTEKLKSSLNELALKYGLTSVAHIGVTPFNPISTTEDILEFANNAYEEAKLIGANEFYIRDKKDLAKDMHIWKELVCDIIDNNKFNVTYINQTLSMDGNNTLLMEETFTSATDNNNKTIQIGTFISVAEMFNKIIDFDKAVITQVLKYIKDEDIKHNIIINLAFDSLVDDNFKSWTQNMLIQNQDIASQLTFSVTAYGCVKDTQSFKTFVALIHQNGAKIMLKRFETKFIPLDNLKEFNLDYIRLAKNYTKEIVSDNSKQSFVESICELSKLLNIKVFAEMVNHEDDFEKLRELGMYGASVKNILKYKGQLTQGIISHCMDDLEDSIVNIGMMGKVATISIELLQNMMNYSKTTDLTSRDIKSAGSIEVTKDRNYTYYIQSKNIISIEDKQKIEPRLLDIQNLDASGIRAKYRELRRSGENAHDKGGGIGFYEIAKLTSSIEYTFTTINEQKYYFEFKAIVESRKKTSQQ